MYRESIKHLWGGGGGRLLASNFVSDSQEDSE